MEILSFKNRSRIRSKPHKKGHVVSNFWRIVYWTEDQGKEKHSAHNTRFHFNANYFEMKVHVDIKIFKDLITIKYVFIQSIRYVTQGQF